jgi:predicted ATPase
VLTLLDSPSTRLSPEELNELAAWVEAAKRGKRP